MNHYTGFLYSQIGYDLPDPKKALVRAPAADFLTPAATLSVMRTESALVTVPLVYWGPKWGDHWWVADFSSLGEEGQFSLEFRDGGRLLHRSPLVAVGQDLLWKATVKPVSFSALAERARLARNGLGFKDCGHHWREVASHTPLLLGLADLLEVGFPHLESDEVEELKNHLIRGCDYLASAQDAAGRLGLGDGALVHEFPTVLHVIPGNVAQAAVVFARTGRLLAETHPDKALDYLSRGKKAFRYLREECPAFPGGFHAPSHGAPEGWEPSGRMTRDLLMLLWASLELWMAGSSAHQAIGAEIARQVLARQVKKDDAEFGYWGHFRTYEGAPFTEKANVHHHWGHDTGAVLPHYLYPLGMMVRLWGYHPDVPLWKKALEDFRDGYLVPACADNPFGILPMGLWKDEGLLTFSGPWHGWNVTYGFASALASVFSFTVGGPGLREIAVANLQWIAGLNTGVTADSFSSCLKYKLEVPEGQALPVSMIHGVGSRNAGCWTGIEGTIMNGFSNNPQFQHALRPQAATDGPWHFTDEDWIPHSGGWIAGLAWLRETKFFQ